MGLLTLGERRRLFLRTSRPIGNQHWNPIKDRITSPAYATNKALALQAQPAITSRASKLPKHRR